jgi:DNA-binding PucR family transcriptional regulator
VSGQQDAFIIKLSHSTSASATSTSVFTGLTVDLSTANATTTALASIDAALYSFTATARNVRSGLIRANRSLSYLANSGESLETAVGQVGPQPAFVADVESFSSSVEEQKRLLGEVKQVKRRLVNNFLSQYIGK